MSSLRDSYEALTFNISTQRTKTVSGDALLEGRAFEVTSNQNVFGAAADFDFIIIGEDLRFGIEAIRYTSSSELFTITPYLNTTTTGGTPISPSNMSLGDANAIAPPFTILNDVTVSVLGSPLRTQIVRGEAGQGSRDASSTFIPQTQLVVSPVNSVHVRLSNLGAAGEIDWYLRIIVLPDTDI